MRAVLGRVVVVLLASATSAQVAHAACHPAPHSNLGCEFYAVTLPNDFANTASSAFNALLLNPSASSAASVQISGGALAMPLSSQLDHTQFSAVSLPWVSAVATATGTVLVTGGAYHIVSDIPLSVVQADTGDPQSSSNDATLLMPVQNFGASFSAIVWPEWNYASGDEPAQVGIVAATAGTTVQISAANLQSGAGLSATGGSVQMNAGDVLLLSSVLTAGVDLSGMQITSSAPIEVFSAHAGTPVPGNASFADHLEDTQPPLTELATDYLLVRPSDPTGGDGARQFVKLLGTVDSTALTFDPAVPGAPASIGADQAIAIELTVDVHLHADHPIQASQFMESASAFPSNTSYLGDPSQLTSIPPNRGALDIVFAAPTALAPVFAQAIAPTGTHVSIDDTAVSGWSAIGSSGYSAANVALCCTDVHHATGDQPFTLSIYAYPSGASTSYWYAAGYGPSDDIYGDGFD